MRKPDDSLHYATRGKVADEGKPKGAIVHGTDACEIDGKEDDGGKKHTDEHATRPA